MNQPVTLESVPDGAVFHFVEGSVEHQAKIFQKLSRRRYIQVHLVAGWYVPLSKPFKTKATAPIRLISR